MSDATTPTPTPKVIRELRFGPAKCYKTGAVVSSYPRPLLCLQFDQEGLDIIKEPITSIGVDKLKDFLNAAKAKGEKYVEPKIYELDFCDKNEKLMSAVYQPNGNSAPFSNFVSTINDLVKICCPFKTVVIDSLSGVGDAILAHIAATSPSSLGSALKWAPMIGGKIYQCISVVTSLGCNVVFIMHASSPQTNETTASTDITPLLPSQWARDRVGTLVSQFFYQCKDGGKPMIYTTDQVYVKGIGCRWPSNLPSKVGPLFNDIYGKENVLK